MRRRQPSTISDSIVDSHLSRRKSSHPVIHTLVLQRTQHLFDSTVLTFCLPIGLGMERRAEHRTRTKQCPERLPEGRREPRVTVVQNHGRNPKKANDIFKKELRHLWGCQFPRPSKHRYQTCELAILTHTADEPVVTTNQRHAKHEVNCPPLEFLVWHGQGLQEASRQGVHIFDALAYRASLDKCCNMLR